MSMSDFRNITKTVDIRFYHFAITKKYSQTVPTGEIQQNIRLRA